PRATADGSSAIDEPVAVDVQALLILRTDEPVVLRLVEPQHRPSHSAIQNHRLSKSVHDPAARQVVRGQLDPHAVAEHDADPIALHPSAEIAERLVAVVELDAEHPPAQSLRDLAFELHFLVLLADDRSVP